MSLSIRKFRQVLAVDQMGSVSRAGDRLGLTQSAVTRTVADVEEQLGYRLFDRHSHGVTATAEGRIFLDRAQRIVADIDQLVSDGEESRKSRDSLVRIAVCPAAVEGLMSRSLSRFITAWPDCRVHMISTNVEHGVQLLRQGDVDLCLGSKLALTAMDDLTSLDLFDLDVSLFVRKGHDLTRTDAISESDLARYPMIVPDMQGPHMHRVRDIVGSDPKYSRQLHIVEHFPLVAEMVRTTNAVGFVANIYAKTAAFQRVFETLDYDVGGTLEIALTFPRANAQHIHVKRLATIIEQGL